MKIQKFAQKGIVLNDKHEILLIKYLEGKYQAEKISGKYALPGGKIEFGETPDESIIKEVQEETGIKCRPGLPIYCWNWEYQKGYDRIQINSVARVCRYLSGSITQFKKEAESTIGGCSWVEMKKILDLDIVEDEIPALRLFINNFNSFLSS